MSLERYFIAIATGKSFIDRFKLAIFLLLDRIFNIKGWKINLRISNEDGEFFCRNLRDFFMYSTSREQDLRKYFKVKEGETFVDVGANIGKYSIMVANRNPKSSVVAVEPYKEGVQMIEKNTALNKLKNIRIVNKVLLDEISEIEFYVNIKNPARNSLFKEEITGQSKYVGENADESFSSQTVRSTTIDEIVESDEEIGLIKIDTQGAELKVLKGGVKVLKKFKPAIIFEAWDEDHLRPIRTFLLQFGYNISQLDDFNYIARGKERVE